MHRCRRAREPGTKLVHNALSDLCNLEDGVFPGLGAGQDVVYALEKGRRKLVVIGPGDG